MKKTPYDIINKDATSLGNIPGWPSTPKTSQKIRNAVQNAILETRKNIPSQHISNVFDVSACIIEVQFLTFLNTYFNYIISKNIGFLFESHSSSLMRMFQDGTKLEENYFFRPTSEKLRIASRPRLSNIPRRIAHQVLSNENLINFNREDTYILYQNNLLAKTAQKKKDLYFKYLTPDQIITGNIPNKLSQQNNIYADIAEAIYTETLSNLEETTPKIEESRKNEIIISLSYVFNMTDFLLKSIDHSFRKPIKNLWTGTGGNYLVRLLRCVVNQRGGQINGFEHGASMIIHKTSPTMHLHEYTYADVWISDTPDKARIYQQEMREHFQLRNKLPVSVSSNSSDPLFKAKPGKSDDIKTVMYVTSPFVGETQYPYMPLMADPVYAYWQRLVIDHLSGLGLRVLVKQHPEGLKKGEPLVMSQKADRYLPGRFEDVTSQADAFVFDSHCTTSLYQAICTEKQIVILDTGMIDWQVEVKEDFEKRVVSIPIYYDENNLPNLNIDHLKSALNDPRDDNGSFRKKYLNQENY